MGIAAGHSQARRRGPFERGRFPGSVRLAGAGSVRLAGVGSVRLQPDRGNVDLIARLHGARVVRELIGIDDEPVADAEPGLLLTKEQRAEAGPFRADDRVLRRAPGLAVEEVNDGGHGVELELLVGVELELHGVRPFGR